MTLTSPRGLETRCSSWWRRPLNTSSTTTPRHHSGHCCLSLTTARSSRFTPHWRPSGIEAPTKVQNNIARSQSFTLVRPGCNAASARPHFRVLFDLAVPVRGHSTRSQCTIYPHPALISHVLDLGNAELPSGPCLGDFERDLHPSASRTSQSAPIHPQRPASLLAAAGIHIRLVGLAA